MTSQILRINSYAFSMSAASGSSRRFVSCLNQGVNSAVQISDGKRVLVEGLSCARGQIEIRSTRLEVKNTTSPSCAPVAAR